ncbi:uncharacterized protein NPIL_205831, partial [Nephila pilipes]
MLIGLGIACNGESCKHKCLENCQGECQLSYFEQLSPCTYACKIDDLYSFHYDSDLKECGKDKVCYLGECCFTNYTERCKKEYGGNYIGIENLREKCTFTCVPTSESTQIYKENIPTGTNCLVDHSDEQGTCRAGTCVTNNESESQNLGEYLINILMLPSLGFDLIKGAVSIAGSGVKSEAHGMLHTDADDTVFSVDESTD